MTLQQKLAAGEFAVTAEIVPPLSASAVELLNRAAPLKGLVDAINVTDAAGARAAMSSFAAAAILKANGHEAVLQVTCRDRNRIALAGDLIGAAAQGVENLLILHGDDPKVGDMPEAKPVHDLDSRAVMTLARQMREEGTLPSGRAIKPPPGFFIGCADAASDPGPGWRPNSLEAKIAAGAQFAQTQFCFDIALARRYFTRLRDLGVTERIRMIAGIGPLTSAKQARHMRDNLFGVAIPDAVIGRLDNATDPAGEGQMIAAELIGELKAIKGVSGVHIMAPMQPSTATAETLRLAGLR